MPDKLFLLLFYLIFFSNSFIMFFTIMGMQKERFNYGIMEKKYHPESRRDLIALLWDPEISPGDIVTSHLSPIFHKSSRIPLERIFQG